MTFDCRICGMICCGSGYEEGQTLCEECLIQELKKENGLLKASLLALFRRVNLFFSRYAEELPSHEYQQMLDEIADASRILFPERLGNELQKEFQQAKP